MSDYYNEEGLNYSTLSLLDSNNISQVFDPEYTREFESLAMDKGSLVDCLLTDPDRFKEEFVISDTRVEITSTAQLICKYLVDNDLSFSSKDNLLEAAGIIGYGGNWKADTVYTKLNTEENKKYYEYLKLKKTGKIIVTQEHYDQALIVIDVLKTHGFTSYIFEPSDTREVLFQVPVYWSEYAPDGTEIKCKALLDIVVIDHQDKMLYPFDLKIKSDSKYAFIKGFLSFKYYLQAAWYTRALEQLAIQRDLYGIYKIANFAFVVTNFDYPDPPLIYQCSDNDLYVGRHGGRLRSNDKEIKGTQQLFNDYVWYLTTGNTSIPKDIYDSSGIISISAFKQT